MKNRIDGCVVVIVDVEGCFGLAFARSLCEAGFHLVVGYQGEQSLALRELMRELRWDGGRIVAVSHTGRQGATMKELALTAIRMYGKLDVVVNIASSPAAGSLETPAALRLQADLYGMAAAFSYSPAPGHGRIINVRAGWESEDSAILRQIAHELSPCDISATRICMEVGPDRFRAEGGRADTSCLSSDVASAAEACVRAVRYVVDQPDGASAGEIRLYSPASDIRRKASGNLSRG